MLGKWGLGALAGGFLLALISLPAAAVIVDVNVESEGEPVPGVTISFETPQGEPIQVAMPEEPVAEPPPVTAVPPEEPPVAVVPPSPPPAAPVVAVEADDRGRTVVELDDRYRDQPVVVIVMRDGEVIGRRQVVLTADVNLVTVNIPPMAPPPVTALPPPPRTPPPPPPVTVDAPPPLVAVPPPVFVPPPPPSGPTFYVHGGGQFGTLYAPRQPFLATEVGEIVVPGAIKYTPDASVTGVEGGVRVQLPAINGLRPFIRGRVGGFRADDDASFGDLSAPFGIPGAGDPDATFPAGVFFGAPGVVATNLRASFEQSSISGSGAVGLVFPFNGIEINPFVGFGISAIDQTTTFSGVVEPFPILFDYRTDLDIRRNSVEFGYMVTAPLPVNGFAAVSLFAEPTIHVDFTSVTGTDRLRFSGFIDDDQSVRIRKKSTDLGFSISGGVRITPPNFPLMIDVGVAYSHRAGAVVTERSGEADEASRGRIEHVDTLVGFLRGSISFPPP